MFNIRIYIYRSQFSSQSISLISSTCTSVHQPKTIRTAAATEAFEVDKSDIFTGIVIFILRTLYPPVHHRIVFSMTSSTTALIRFLRKFAPFFPISTTPLYLYGMLGSLTCLRSLNII